MPASKSRRPSAKRPAGKKSVEKRAARSHATVSGPAQLRGAGEGADALTAKLEATQALAAAMPRNSAKPAEHGQAARTPPAGQTVQPDPVATGSTLSERNASDKTGDGQPRLGFNPGSAPLDRVRVDSTSRPLTTNQGVRVADNQNSLKAG